MTHYLRYTSICLWLALLVGGIGSLGVLPALRPLVGADLMPVAAAAGLTAIFMIVAWTVDRIGMRQVARLVHRADVAEREGLSAKAEAALREAMGILDRFWISPANRRNVLMPLAARLARCCLARTGLDAAADDFIVRYLYAQPEDDEVAEQWLRQLGSKGGLREEHQDLADRLGNAHPRHPDIQKALAHFYLALERTDFIARRSYRRVCNSEGQPPAELCAEIARFLRTGQRSDTWAQQGHSHVQAPLPAMEMTEVSWRRSDPRLAAEAAEGETAAPADEWGGAEDVFRIAADADAMDDEGAEERVSLLRESRAVWPHPRRFGQAAASAIKAVLKECRRLGGLSIQTICFACRLRGVRYGLGVLVLAGLTVGGIWVVLDGIEVFHATPSEPAGAESQASASAAVTDPFTLQVAAYLKQDYAVRLVEDLKRKGLDAYWTETSSGGKLWYQVRVSRFSDQQSARAYGRTLKGRGVIDDFYVTNYVP